MTNGITISKGLIAIILSAIIISGCKHSTPVTQLPPDTTAKGKLPYGSDLKEAIQKDQVATVKTLLASGVDINGTDIEGSTPLGEACSSGKVGLIKVLLDAGANPNERTINGWYPIDLVATSPSSESTKILIDAGADVNQMQIGGDSALSMALNRGAPETASLLIQSGADPNLHGPNAHSPLYDAALIDDSSKTPTIVQMLLDKRATMRPDECRFATEAIEQKGDTKALSVIKSAGICPAGS